jgi:uncharacterized surface protein with fasciclin (FAS1) repeats
LRRIITDIEQRHPPGETAFGIFGKKEKRLFFDSHLTQIHSISSLKFTAMRINLLVCAVSTMLALGVFACVNSTNESPGASVMSAASPTGGGQSAVQDDVSQKDVVKVAAGSPDHTTLVAAVKAAGLVDVLSNAGPFTVFAPTNAAFDQLPDGTLEGLLQPDKKEALQDILQYHVAVAVYKPEMLSDGQVLSMANGGNVTIGVQGERITVNGANVVASIPASNGLVYVIDGVLLPK